MLPILFGGTTVPQYFHLGYLTVRFYSLFFVIAILAAFFISRLRAKKLGIGSKIFNDTTFWLLINGFIGARIYYVAFNLDYYSQNILEVFQVWRGGLAIYGGLIAGALTLIYFCKRYSLDFWNFADSIALGLPIAQIIGRVGNFFNYEAFGKPSDNGLAMYVPEQFRPKGFESFETFHPTFLYEILWNGLVFFLLLSLIRLNKRLKMPTGVIAGAYITLYSLGRTYIEELRLDSLYWENYRISQILALLLIFIGLCIILSRYESQARK